ncbi:staphopain A [Enterococcus sp. AZ126]
MKDENGKYTTKLSKMLVDELNFLKRKDFSKGISLIASENGDIYYENDGEITLLWSSPEALSEGNQTDPENVLLEKVKNSDLEIINLNESLEYNVDGIKLRSTTVDKFGTRINWKISETQGDDKWCIAYAAAMILNNKNDARPTKASDIGKWGKRGKNVGFTDDEMVKYANTRGVYPKLLSRPTTWSETITQLRKSNGVLGVWESQVHTWHAIDITGTYMSDTANGRKNVFVIWNPWRTYVELIDAPTNKPIKYIANSDRTYTWRRSITNW